MRRRGLNRVRQRTLAAFLAAFGALLALVGQLGDELALTALGGAIMDAPQSTLSPPMPSGWQQDSPIRARAD